MVGDAAPHGRPHVTQEGHVGRPGERGITWATNGRTAWLRSGVWHHGGLKYRRLRPSEPHVHEWVFLIFSAQTTAFRLSHFSGSSPFVRTVLFCTVQHSAAL